MSEPRFKAQVVEGEVMLHLWSGSVEALAKLSPNEAQNLAQLLLATADEALGERSRYPTA